MEIYEKINYLLKEKNITKKEFAKRLIELEPKSNRTGEVISEKIVYSYLSGHTAIKADLLPYISDVLGVPEQLFFIDDEKTRSKILKHIVKTANGSDKKHIKNLDIYEDPLTMNIIRMLDFAPKAFLEKIEAQLKEYKKITEKF
ncbi:MAG: XRE family transcriptional regulator [Campylobacterales bacterium]|nr:XRE family transcriptional regulator [Campylobacterales bacterium]